MSQHRLVHDPGGQAGVCASDSGTAAGLRDGDNDYHLVTFKPDPAPHPPDFCTLNPGSISA